MKEHRDGLGGLGWNEWSGNTSQRHKQNVHRASWRQSSQQTSKKMAQTEKPSCLPTQTTLVSNIQTNVHMTVMPLVCLPSVALCREAADAALGPAANMSYLLLVWSLLPQIRNTTSTPAKQGLSHLFWPTGASHEITVIFKQKGVQKIKATPQPANLHRTYELIFRFLGCFITWFTHTEPKTAIL